MSRDPQGLHHPPPRGPGPHSPRLWVSLAWGTQQDNRPLAISPPRPQSGKWAEGTFGLITVLATQPAEVSVP